MLKIRLYTVQMNFSGFEVSKLVPICNCGCGCGLEDTLRGAEGFKIGVTLDALLTFTKLGGLMGHLMRFRGPRGTPGVKCGP